MLTNLGNLKVNLMPVQVRFNHHGGDVCRRSANSGKIQEPPFVAACSDIAYLRSGNV